MAVTRPNTSADLFRRLTKLQVVRNSSGLSTTASVSLAQSATVITAATTTAWSTAASALIIDGPIGTELNQTTAVGTATTTLVWKINAAQSTADGTITLYEAASITLGHLEQGGVTLSPTYSQTPYFSAIQDTPLVYIGGVGEISASFVLSGFNVLNWATAFGALESDAMGTATAADPDQMWYGGTRFGAQTIQCFRFTGASVDGKIVFVEINNARAEASGQSTLNSQTPAGVPITVKGTSMTIRRGTSLSAT